MIRPRLTSVLAAATVPLAVAPVVAKERAVEQLLAAGVPIDPAGLGPDGALSGALSGPAAGTAPDPAVGADPGAVAAADPGVGTGAAPVGDPGAAVPGDVTSVGGAGPAHLAPVKGYIGPVRLVVGGALVALLVLPVIGGLPDPPGEGGTAAPPGGRAGAPSAPAWTVGPGDLTEVDGTAATSGPPTTDAGAGSEGDGGQGSGGEDGTGGAGGKGDPAGPGGGVGDPPATTAPVTTAPTTTAPGSTARPPSRRSRTAVPPTRTSRSTGGKSGTSPTRRPRPTWSPGEGGVTPGKPGETVDCNARWLPWWVRLHCLTGARLVWVCTPPRGHHHRHCWIIVVFVWENDRLSSPAGERPASSSSPGTVEPRSPSGEDGSRSSPVDGRRRDGDRPVRGPWVGPGGAGSAPSCWHRRPRCPLFPSWR